MELRTISQLKAAEKAAKDAYYATAKAGSKADAALYDVMVTATQARQAATTAFAAQLI